MRRRSRALAATRRCRRIVGLGGLVDFLRPPRPRFGGVGLPDKLTGELIGSPRKQIAMRVFYSRTFHSYIYSQ